MANDKQPEHPGNAAMVWLKTERDQTDDAVQRLRKAGEGEGVKGVMIESAVATAQSNRELAASTITAAETIDFSLKTATRLMTAEADLLAARLDQLRTRIDAFAVKADEGTRRLVRATWALAAAAVVASAIQAYVMWSAAPQIVIIPSPTSAAPIVITPPVISSPVPPR
jgi:hypothetical protein